ncbi:MAG: HesB/IscA family protein [Candidatus Cyclobacteriaceae bacterium M2_1C_046]
MIQPVSLSDKAVEEVKDIMSKKNIPEGYGLRVGMRGGGCGGMSFMLGFDKAKDTDLTYEYKGVPVMVEKRHTMYLIGLEVDFHEGSDARGFTFVKPEETTAD